MSGFLAQDVGDRAQNIIDWAVNVGLKTVIFVLIVIAGWIISRGLYRLIERLLDKVGFNRLAERSGIRRFTGDYRPSDLFAKIIYYLLLLVTLQLAFNVYGPNPISNLLNNIVGWLPRLLVALVIVIVAAAIGNAVFDVIHNALDRLPYGRMLGRIAQIFIIALGVIAALNQIGIATTVTGPVLIAFLATIVGIAIVGIGGGLVRPMTSRWERMLNRAEAEGARAAQHMRERQAQRARAGGFEQPAYPGRTGSQAQQDVQRAADQAARESRERSQQQGR
jgi:small-conductance mechanosensitive channel